MYCVKKNDHVFIEDCMVCNHVLNCQAQLVIIRKEEKLPKVENESRCTHE